VSSAPATRISLEFGIDNLVAVGVVHAENKLTPQLESQVAEIQRLGTEIKTRTDELMEIYTKTEIDEGFKEDCQALIALAGKLGMHLSVELLKGSFNPGSFAYNVTARFRGDTTTVRNYVVDAERAIELRDEIAGMREQQTEYSKAATRTKSHLNGSWLEKQLRATIARNAMNETSSGAEALQMMLADLDHAIDAGSQPIQKQIGKK
jgi:hypothetical protein